MATLTWQQQVRNAWSKDGKVGDFLALFGVSQEERDRVDRLVGLNSSTLLALESLEDKGEADLVQRVLDAALHALENGRWDTIPDIPEELRWLNAEKFQERLRLAKEGIPEAVALLQERIEKFNADLDRFGINLERAKRRCRAVLRRKKSSHSKSARA